MDDFSNKDTRDTNAPKPKGFIFYFFIRENRGFEATVISNIIS